MRKLIVSEFVSLDGVMEAPGGEPGHPHSGWTFDYHDEEQMKYKLEETLEARVAPARTGDLRGLLRCLAGA